MGRLFDCVASITDVVQRNSYHAQAPTALEHMAMKSSSRDSYTFVIKNSLIYQMPIIEGIISDLDKETAVEDIARKFHNTVAEIIISAVRLLRDETGISTVALSGGVFQNGLLLEDTFNRLMDSGFTPLIHQLVPPNDGGLSLGQAVYAKFAHV